VALPLKLWRPGRFDGVALVAGSAAPDAYYALNGYVAVPPTHNLPGLFWFGLPVALLATALVRWAAPVVGAHLPARPGWLALRDYGVLGRVHHPWHVTVWSALLGAATHVAWDGFTHNPSTRHGWAARLVPGLEQEAWSGMPWWLVAQHASTVAGAAVALAMAIHIGRRRLLRTWHGRPPRFPRTPALFWPVAAAVALLYPVTWPLLRYRHATYVQGVRIIWTVALALLAAAAACRLAAQVRPSRPSRPAAVGREAP
jgi:hypothetical protein